MVNRIDTPMFSCGLHLSGDRGASWQGGQLPFPAGEELPERCFAPGEPVRVNAPGHVRAVVPSVVVGSDGRVHVLYIDMADDALDYHGAHGRGARRPPGLCRLSRCAPGRRGCVGVGVA